MPIFVQQKRVQKRVFPMALSHLGSNNLMHIKRRDSSSAPSTWNKIKYLITIDYPTIYMLAFLLYFILYFISIPNPSNHNAFFFFFFFFFVTRIRLTSLGDICCNMNGRHNSSNDVLVTEFFFFLFLSSATTCDSSLVNVIERYTVGK